jgi:hypothetical protein
MFPVIISQCTFNYFFVVGSMHDTDEAAGGACMRQQQAVYKARHAAGRLGV